MSNENISEQTPDSGKEQEVIDKTDVRIPAALVRTMLAADNSLMAWIRTSISLYAFGFSIITFFDYMGKQNSDIHSYTITILIGLALILVGIISLGFISKHICILLINQLNA